METITISNQKGGVGKSTVAVHLAMYLAEKGSRVLFVELDPQGNACKTLSFHNCVSIVPASSFFFDSPLNEMEEVEPGQILAIGADEAMADIERADPSVLRVFKENIEAVDEGFDYCVMDTPPTLGLRMTAALIVSDYVLSPIELEEYSIDGITKMLRTIFGVKEKFNPKLKFLGMVPNRFNARSLSQKETMGELIKNHSSLLIKSKISLRVSIPEALSEGLPVWALKKTAAREAAKEMIEVFDMVIEKMGNANG